jgi:site-specific DNA recombinase
VYYGAIIWNRRHGGKFYEVKGGEIVTTARTRKRIWIGQEQDWIVCEAPHLAVVDRILFDRVQRKLVENRDSCTPNRGRRLYLLTGLLFCSECGWPMHGIARHTNCRRQQDKHNAYVCGNYNTYRKRGGCLFNAVDESPLLDVVAEKVTAHFLRPEIREALREEIRRQERAEREGRESPTASLNARIAALDRKISEGTEKWLAAPPSLTDVIGGKLEEWRQERDRLRQERRELEKPAPNLDELDAAVERILEGMGRLRENIATDPPGAKVVLREVIEKVECRFSHAAFGKTRQKSTLVGGMIHIREDILLCRPVAIASPQFTLIQHGEGRADSGRFVDNGGQLDRPPGAGCGFSEQGGVWEDHS